ncbi:glycosyltransferase [Streptomyces sp. NPDC020983]|uniref:glycosyltransferase n=1 Tax=Streptomyces sp. NPDC020983 TaxID=3365106 RepID=UPI0037A7F698
MTDVLLVASNVPQPAVLRSSLEKFAAAGATVRLAVAFALDEIESDLPLAEAYSLSAAAEAAHGAKFMKNAAKASLLTRTWRYAQGDRWLRRYGRKADVLVALDQAAIYTVWRLAERNRRADAVFGVAAALKALDDRAARPGHYAVRDVYRSLPSPVTAARTTARAARKAYYLSTSGKIMRTAVGAKAWRAAVGAPKLPDGVRAEMAVRVSNGMVKGGRKTGATLVLTQAAEQVGDLAIKTDLMARAGRRTISPGADNPKTRTAAISAQLALADQLYAEGDPKGASKQLSAALSLAFHRALHFDRMTSPLTEDTAAYLAPFRASKVFAELSRPRGRQQPAAPIPTDRPLRLLVTTYANANFLQPIMDRYADHPGVEIRYLSLKEDEDLRKLATSGLGMMEYQLGGLRGLGTAAEHALRPHLDWADTVFVDWATNAAALFTLIDPGDTRIVVRLHSYEAWTFWPHVMDVSRIDDLVFVGDHLRDLTVDVLSALREPGGPKLHVIANAMDLPRYQRPKTSADARFTLGLVGVSAVAKDPRWALEVLRELRKHDERYRLVVVGDLPDREASGSAKQYVDQLNRELVELTETGAVSLLGRSDDVPSVLTDIGVILSTSVRESFHCALVEGTVSGALPVVRDWPFFAGKENGARTIYPADWIVATPEEAAGRILAHTTDADAWRQDTAEASKYALDTWDWSVISPQFDRLFLGRG